MQHRVSLTAAGHAALQAVLATNTTRARTAKQAQALLLTDRRGPGWPDAQVATATGLSVRTVYRVRLEWTTRARETIHVRPRRTVTQPKLDDEQTTRLLAQRQADPPPGHATWTLRMLARTAVELAIVPSVSYETVRRTFKKTASSSA